MESTLKDIKSKTYGIVTNPTYMSYSLIGLTTFILGYYVFYDKNSSPGSSEAEASAESATSSEGANASTSALGGMFGSSETKGEDAPSEGASVGIGGIGGMFGSENKEEAPSENNDAASGEPAGAGEEPKEETSVGGKRKKTRRQRKQSRKQNKSKHAKKKN